MLSFESTSKIAIVLLLLCSYSYSAHAQYDVHGSTVSLSQDDPNANPDWDWTVDQNYKLYTTDGERSVQLPYFDSQSLVFPYITESNVDPNNGWELLYRDFGESGREIKDPRFILHNRYTGVMRVFLYNTNDSENFSDAFVRVNLEKAGSASGSLPPLFMSYEENGYLNNENHKEEIHAKIKYGNDKWVYFDINTSYIPNLNDPEYEDSVLTFEVVGVNVSSLTVDGDINADFLYSGSSSSFGVSVADWLDQYPDGITAALSFKESFKEADSAKERWAEVAYELFDGGLGSAIESLQSVPIVDFVPGLSNFSGFLTSAIGGGTDTRLSGLTGEVELTGNSESIKRNLNFFSLRVPGTQMSNEIGEPLNNFPLGVFYIKNKPVLEEELTELDCFEIDGGQACDKYFKISTAEGNSNNDVFWLDWELNPRITSEPNFYYIYGHALTSFRYGRTEAAISRTGRLDNQNYHQDYNSLSLKSDCVVRWDGFDQCEFLDLGVSLKFEIEGENSERFTIYQSWPAPIETSTTSTASQSGPTQNETSDEFEKILYPNPASNSVNNPNENVTSTEVYDINGRKVMSFENDGPYDISDLSSGTYFFKMMTEDSSYTQRITVVR